MKLSKLASDIAESPTFALNEEARQLKQRGEAVINLGIGEPKNKTPISAVLASGARLSSGEVKYTPPDGLPSMKKAVIRYTEENYDRLVSPDNVIVTNGAKQSLFNIFYSILNPQDEAIIIAPYWVSYPEMIKMCMGIPVVVTPEDGTFTPRFEEIERAVTSSTRAIVVNSPNNPSGAIYPDELIAKIADLCKKKGIFMICDDIYHKLTFDGNVATPAYAFTKDDIENSNIIVVNGVAKLYGMTGFRVGWVVAPRELIRVMTNVIAQTTSCVSPIAQAAAEGALNGLQSVVESLRLQIENNRNVLLQEMKSFKGARLIEPQGTFYALPDLRAFKDNSVDASRFLLKKALVVTVPGKEFGMEGHIRISFAGSATEVTEGLARIRWALDPTSPSEIYIGDKKMTRDWM
ncbi:MAG: pyridoxal phosphate-dependent aminotransferase [Chloroflexi bacterium]|nr:pyridoxal phosphate-dependent aminotransferase [Chloroflexi bacterium CFX1]MCK6566391.1 pyridoxal phosphate-dependent aminotransferase [Anaerolineales bacterium]MCQ3952987.1 pyridoxal phosphate-dependent aminotransferase [Chloroflexota bacterium]MDL1919500.1 pyridoxal phosphate-dependent aminotransferase [Chloroflexi bacterium CFX5]NUQ58617.1 pyridoxal phosphate-dependent aminotransferase [Anaerolineales bacterium]